MKMKLYSFYDNKAKAFSQPFVMPSDAEASRGFLALCSDDSTKFCVYPEDYEIFSLGEFCDQSGILTSVSPERLLTGLQAKAEITERVKQATLIANSARSIQTAEESSPQGQAEGASYQSTNENPPTLQDMINFLEQQ